MVDIARFRKSDNRVNKHVGSSLSGSSDCEFSVGSVHRVSCLESDDFAPC
jgi:hypothetical protein